MIKLHFINELHGHATHIQILNTCINERQQKQVNLQDVNLISNTIFIVIN